jgi:dihydrofolate reductase
MSKLIYVTHVSLDGYIEDEHGSFAWSDPAHVFDFITELIRPVGTHLLGRRLYEMMTYWDRPVETYPPEHQEFVRVWQQANQIVFSRTLTAATRVARVERQFDPEAIRTLKGEAAHDIFIGGAELAGQAFDAGLVDECHLFIHPVIVGAGKPAFRHDLRQDLELLETRPFGSGAIYVRYRVHGARA